MENTRKLYGFKCQQGADQHLLANYDSFSVALELVGREAGRQMWMYETEEDAKKACDFASALFLEPTDVQEYDAVASLK